MPFWPSILILSVLQGLLVAVPGVWEWPERHLSRLRSGWWALIPVASLIGVAFGLTRIAAAPDQLTYLALWAVPALAVVSLGWAMHGARPIYTLLVVPLFGLAWVLPSALLGQGAATLLTALSCVSLAGALVAVTPSRLVRVGVVVMAVIDAILVFGHHLTVSNNLLIHAHPIAQLPRMQAVLFGSAAMGYGDLFVACVVGALVVARPGRQWKLALVITGLTVVSNVGFIWTTELPATVPVAVGLVGSDAYDAIRRHRARRSISECGGQ